MADYAKDLEFEKAVKVRDHLYIFKQRLFGISNTENTILYP